MSEAARVKTKVIGRCKYCFCTDARACDSGCTWLNVEHSVCSACAVVQPFTPADLRHLFKTLGVRGGEVGVALVTEIIEAFEARGYRLAPVPAAAAGGGAQKRGRRGLANGAPAADRTR